MTFSYWILVRHLFTLLSGFFLRIRWHISLWTSIYMDLFPRKVKRLSYYLLYCLLALLSGFFLRIRWQISLWTSIYMDLYPRTVKRLSYYLLYCLSHFINLPTVTVGFNDELKNTRVPVVTQARRYDEEGVLLVTTEISTTANGE